MASPEKSLSGKAKGGAKKSKKKAPKHKIRHTHIEHGDDGSHVIRHSFDQGGPEDEQVPDSVHGVSDSSGLLAHLQSQLGGQLPPPDASGGASAAGAGVAAPPAAAGAGM